VPALGTPAMKKSGSATVCVYHRGAAIFPLIM
jgi:hypothetical protein